MSEPDWENFAKAILTEWPTGALEGFDLFNLSLQYGMIQEVPGGYNSDHHTDAEGICPEEGDPWYEYTFRSKAGPGLYSISDMNKRIEELEANLETCKKYRDAYAECDRISTHALRKAVEALECLIQHTHTCEKELTEDLHHLDFCGESEPLTKARTTLKELKGKTDE